MKVMLVADSVGGVFSHALDLCDALHARDVQVLLATMGSELREWQRQQIGGRPWLRCESRPYRLMWMPDPWLEVEAAGAWLLRLGERFSPDVVHLNDYAHAVLPWQAPVLLAAHSCVCSWFAAVRGCDPPPVFDRYRERVVAAVARADLVVAPTNAMLREVRRWHGFPRRTRVISNGITRFPRTATRRTAQVVAAGRLWDPAKNLAVLHEVAARCTWPIAVAGETGSGTGAGDDGAGALRLLGELPRPQLRDLFARAAIFLHPALYEPFGLAPLEAAAAGCALVLGDLPTLREVWGDAALYAPPGDAGALLGQLQRLAADPVLLASMARRARLRAGRYRATRMAGAYHEAYCELAGRGPDQRQRLVPLVTRGGAA